MHAYASGPHGLSLTASEGNRMTAQAFEVGRFADVRGADDAAAADLGAAGLALGAGFVAIVVVGDALGATLAGAAVVIEGSGAA